MGKKAPAAPDPVATANAQGAINADTARLQAQLNRGDTFTPFGTVTQRPADSGWLTDQQRQYREAFDRGDYNPLYFDAQGNRAYQEGAINSMLTAMNPDKDRWNTTVTLSPEQQRLYQQGVDLDTGAGQLALDMLPRARATLEAPMMTDDPDARNRASQAILSRLEPQFQRDRDDLESRLTAQGFRPGSEAYNRAADELARARTDARLQADMYGSQESRAGAAFSNAQRGQQINELGMLFGLGPGMQVPTAAALSPVGVNAPDLMGMTQQNYAQRVQGVNAGNQALASLLGAGVGAAGYRIFR